MMETGTLMSFRNQQTRIHTREETEHLENSHIYNTKENARATTKAYKLLVPLQHNNK